MVRWTAFLSFILILASFGTAWSQGQVVELTCPSCGYVKRFAQGTTPDEKARNLQNVILVCERDNLIRNVRIPIDPNAPSKGDPLMAKQFGMGTSKLLGIELPKFLVPGNTCPLYPVTAYLNANICPIDGSRGFYSVIVGHY
jgi:hypothetical protein